MDATIGVQSPEASLEVLIQQSALMSSIFNSSPDSIGVAAIDGRIIHCNHAAPLMLGYASPDDIIGKNAFDFVDPEFQTQVARQIETAIAHGSVKDFEIKMVKKSGESFWVQASLGMVQDEERPPRFMVAIIKDISERKKAADRYHTVIHTAMDGFWQVDLQGRIRDVNEAYCRLSGYTREELLGARVSDIDPDESAEEVKRRIETLLRDGQGSFEARHRGKNGRIMDVVANITYLEQDHSFYTFIHDITSRRAHERRLEWESRVNASLAELGNQLLGRGYTLEGIGGMLLTQAKNLTGAKNGFVCYLESENATAGQDAMSVIFDRKSPGGVIYKSSFARDSEGFYPGMWGHALNERIAFFTNTPSNHPAYRTPPENHIAIANYLAAPTLLGGEILGQIALANCPDGFNELHLEAVQKLAGFYSLALLRYRAQLQLDNQREQLERLVTERTAKYREAEILLKYRSDFERLVSEISSRFIGLKADEVDEHIETALKELVAFTQCASGAVFMFDHRGLSFSLTHLYNSPPFHLRREDYQEMECAASPWWTAPILRGECVAVPSVRQLPDEAATEKKILETIGFSSVIAIPMRYEGRAAGFLTLGVHKRERLWSATEINLLHLVGQVFTSALLRVRMQDQLRQAQKMESIGALAGGIAHDFNNILGIISGYCELAEDEAKDNSYMSWCLGHIRQASNRARDLVKRILTFSRGGERESKPLKIAPLVEEAVKLLRSTLPTGISIHLDIREGAGTVLADPTQLQQVLMNLCVNARDAMKEKGGALTISISDMDADGNIASGLAPGRYRRLSIADTGAGVSPAIIDLIFDPYFTTKAKGEGAGLGLSVVHGIVKHHAGDITVENIPGRGAAFHVHLPIHDLESEDEDAGEEPAPGGHERILAVDDEPSLTAAMRWRLEKLGYRVIAETDSIKALELFRAHPEDFDLVITDWNMPRLRGDLLAREIQTVRSVPVILCTGYASELDEQEMLAGGIRKVLLKPLNRTMISRAIREVLDAAGR